MTTSEGDAKDQNEFEAKDAPTYYTHDGLLWYGDNLQFVSTIIADMIAQANGFLFVERLVHKYPNHTFKIAASSRLILSVSPTTNSDPT